MPKGMVLDCKKLDNTEFAIHTPIGGGPKRWNFAKVIKYFYYIYWKYEKLLEIYNLVNVVLKVINICTHYLSASIIL